MSTPFLGELKLMSFNFAPQGWALCNGQLLPINQNQALFALLGTMYGGNGQTNFALPDLRGRAPQHVGGGFVQGQTSGQEFHTVTVSELPEHIHLVNASSKLGDQPQIGTFAGSNNLYAPPSDLVSLHPSTIPNVGGSQAHENRPPFTVLSWCISLQGVFPSQN